MKPRLTNTPIADLFIIETQLFNDERGFFTETWNKNSFTAAGLHADFVQENHSRSKKGVLRGLHYQNMQEPLIKLVRCIRGEIYDVAVDLRTGSATFGQWFGILLNEDNKKQLYIPVGFAHGFASISDNAEVEYKQTAFYNPAAEGTIVWNDPEIAIDWPVTDPALTEKDKKGMTLAEYRKNPVFS
jgi:dTDP-4-dehydrorhamnose 3,5-epimerase